VTRDEFEEWVESAHDDAVESLPGSATLSLGGWTKLYASMLKHLAAEELKEKAESGDDLDGPDDDDDELLDAEEESE
jgi:hypothetical protein